MNIVPSLCVKENYSTKYNYMVYITVFEPFMTCRRETIRLCRYFVIELKGFYNVYSFEE